MVHVELSWDPPEGEGVVSYEIERRPKGPSQSGSRLRRIGYNWFPFNALSRRIFPGWRKVATVNAGENTFTDNRDFPVRRWFRPTYTHNSQLLPFQSYEYRIRTVNGAGKRSYWTYTVAQSLGPPASVSGASGKPASLRIIRAQMIVPNLNVHDQQPQVVYQEPRVVTQQPRIETMQPANNNDGAADN